MADCDKVAGLCVRCFHYRRPLISGLVYTTLNINTRKVRTDMGCAENSNYIVCSGILSRKAAACFRAIRGVEMKTAPILS